MNGWQRREAGSAQQNKTPHIYLQADSRTYSPQQLFEHELFHSVVAANKGLWTDIVDHLYQTNTQEEIVRMVDAYVKAYRQGLETSLVNRGVDWNGNREEVGTDSSAAASPSAGTTGVNGDQSVTNAQRNIDNADDSMYNQEKGARRMDYTKKLEEEYGQDSIAQRIIRDARQDGLTDEEIYDLLESFY